MDSFVVLVAEDSVRWQLKAREQCWNAGSVREQYYHARNPDSSRERNPLTSSKGLLYYDVKNQVKNVFI